MLCQVGLLGQRDWNKNKPLFACGYTNIHALTPINVFCNMPTIELVIYGKVQGVFFRDSTRKKALQLGIAGWVRNERDGSVRVRATGQAEALNDLESWCNKGPEMASVKTVKRKELPEEPFIGFAILR